jgi:hypothetical protein
MYELMGIRQKAYKGFYILVLEGGLEKWKAREALEEVIVLSNLHHPIEQPTNVSIFNHRAPMSGTQPLSPNTVVEYRFNLMQACITVASL